MENTKIGNKEAVALLTTISFNQIIIFGVKSIINNTSSASLLNLLYLSIIILIFTSLICYLLNKFPSFDLLDISDYLGGKEKALKAILGNVMKQTRGRGNAQEIEALLIKLIKSSSNT